MVSRSLSLSLYSIRIYSNLARSLAVYCFVNYSPCVAKRLMIGNSKPMLTIRNTARKNARWPNCSVFIALAIALSFAPIWWENSFLGYGREWNAQIYCAHDFDHRIKLLDCIIDYSIEQPGEKPKTHKKLLYDHFILLYTNVLMFNIVIVFVCSRLLVCVECVLSVHPSINFTYGLCDCIHCIVCS